MIGRTVFLALASLALPALALAAPAPVLPAVTCNPETYQASLTVPADVVHAEFVVRNTYGTEARVVNVTPSCTCLTVAPFKQTIPPGGEVEVLIDVDLRGHDGPETKDVLLDLQGVPQKQLTLPILILRD